MPSSNAAKDTDNFVVALITIQIKINGTKETIKRQGAFFNIEASHLNDTAKFTL